MKSMVAFCALCALLVPFSSAPSSRSLGNGPSKRTELADAADRGDLEAVKRLLDAGVNPDDRHVAGDSTPLMRAAFRGHVEIMKLLIAKGANVYAEMNCGKDRGQQSVLEDAAAGGHFEAAALLVDNGADVNHVGEDKKTPLHHAVYWGGEKHKGSKEIAKLLIEKGADVNAKAWSSEWTPLMCAVSRGNTEIIELLLANGADVNAASAGGTTPLQLAKTKARKTGNESYSAIAHALIAHGGRE